MIIDLRPDEKGAGEQSSRALNVSIYEKPKSAPKAALEAVSPPVQKVSKPMPAVQKRAIKKKAIEAETIVNEPVQTTVISPEPVQEIASEVLTAPAPAAAKIVPVAVKADIPKFADTASLQIKYRDKVRDIIASNKMYPVTARRRGIQGSVTVAFSVYEDGEIIDPAVEASSGFDMLDRAALQILADSSPLPVPPEQMDFSLPISFRLN